MSVTRHFGIPLQKAKKILRDVEAAVATWRETGRMLGMTEIDLGQFADAFEHSVQRDNQGETAATIRMRDAAGQPSGEGRA